MSIRVASQVNVREIECVHDLDSTSWYAITGMTESP